MWRVLTACQISTASVSFVASSIVAIIVARSRKRTNTSSAAGGRGDNSSRNDATTFVLAHSPYHRIIFGLSISDILQSFAILSGPFSSPRYVPQALWGAGNKLTCNMNGVFFVVGFTSTSMYTFFLCYFCLCKVKTNMTDDAFSQKIEWKMHKFIIAFNIIVCVAGLITKTFNTFNGRWCIFAPVPDGCIENPEIYGECDETISRNATFLAFATRFVTTLLCLAGIIVCMAKICWHVMITTNTTRTTRLSHLRSQHLDVTQQTHRDEHNANAADLLVRHYRRQFFIQASLYVLAYAATHSFTWIGVMVVLAKKQELDSVFLLLASIFYPLGGLFNILVYTRPKVLSLRRNNPQYCWFRAFILVVRAGGVVPAAVDTEEVLPSNVQSPVLVGQEPVPSHSSGVSSLLRDLSSIGTPPFSLANALSSGNTLISGGGDSKQDNLDQAVDRKFYHVPPKFCLLDSSPSLLFADALQNNACYGINNQAEPSNVSGTEQRTKNNGLLSSRIESAGMGTIMEETEEGE